MEVESVHKMLPLLRCFYELTDKIQHEDATLSDVFTILADLECRIQGFENDDALKPVVQAARKAIAKRQGTKDALSFMFEFSSTCTPRYGLLSLTIPLQTFLPAFTGKARLWLPKNLPRVHCCFCPFQLSEAAVERTSHTQKFIAAALYCRLSSLCSITTRRSVMRNTFQKPPKKRAQKMALLTVQFACQRFVVV